MIIRIGGGSKTLYAADFEEAVAVIRAHYYETHLLCAYYLDDDEGKYLGRFSNSRFWVGNQPLWEPLNVYQKRLDKLLKL